MSAWITLAFVLFLLAFGLVGALRPYRLARFSEQLDAIGSTRSLGDVEPADWKVHLTRLAAIALSIVSAGILLFVLASLV